MTIDTNAGQRAYQGVKPLRIAFFGHRDYSDFYGVGGMQSYGRRLVLGLAHRGVQVDYIVSGASETKEIDITPKLSLKYFHDFADAYDYIASRSYSHIIRMWFPRRERIEYLVNLYRRSKKKVRYHYLWFIVPEQRIKSHLMLIEAALTSHKGRIICVSYRQYQMMEKSAKSFLLLPPVPESYFLAPGEKPTNKKVKVTFLGMLHPDKGVEDVILLFRELQNDPRFECAIYAIHNPSNKASLEFHERLSHQNTIKYVNLRTLDYPSKAEEIVKSILKRTDIFVQPYQKLLNTVDTPLLLLESMASLCAVLTTPLGSIPDIYGKSRFLIDKEDFVSSAITLLQDLSFDDLRVERERIYARNKLLGFSTSQIVDKLLEGIGEK